jgi:hypothetical protein
MRHRVLIALALAAFALPTAAQETPPAGALPDRIASCAKDLNDTGRLRCFDALAAEISTADSTSAPAASATSTPSPAGAENVESEPAGPSVLRDERGKITNIGTWYVDREIDALTDRPRTTLINKGEGERSNGNPDALVFRCQDGKLDAFIALNAYLGTSGNRIVRYRIDNKALVTQTWLPSTNGRTAFAPDASALLRSIIDASTFIVEATAFDGSRSRGTFTLDGLKEIAPDLETCLRASRPSSPTPANQSRRRAS